MFFILKENVDRAVLHKLSEDFFESQAKQLLHVYVLRCPA